MCCLMTVHRYRETTLMTDREQGAGRDRGTDQRARQDERAAYSDDAHRLERLDEWRDRHDGGGRDAPRAALTDRERQERWPVG